MILTRRNLLVTGGAGLGLAVAWAVWPRSYRANLTAAPGETVYGAWLKIGEDGHVTVAIPQCEHGQGVWTTLPQILADELGADWRTVGVEPAPINPLYANPLAAQALFAGVYDRMPASLRATWAERAALMLTGGSTSIRAFEPALREAGAAARVLLCKAAAARWNVDWTTCDTNDGFVAAGQRRLRFADLAVEAAAGDLPDELPLRIGDEGRLSGRSLPRLDVPSKVDGSANFAGDVRLPDMAFASVRTGPIGDTRLISVNRAAAERIRGVSAVVESDRWVAAVADNWWAANRALDALAPRFATAGRPVDDAAIEATLAAALATDGVRMAEAGDVEVAFRGAKLVTADYHAAAGVHAAIEPMTATAWAREDRLELWLPTQAPTLARRAAARALGLPEAAVTVHAMQAGGSFGQNLEVAAAVQAATIARAAKRPVQLTWSRGETTRADAYRAPVAARMTARLSANGAILGWRAQIAAPATGREMAMRLVDDGVTRAALALLGRGDAYAVSGATPIYRIPAMAIDHHPAALDLPTGHLRGGADGYTCFFTECFIDELAEKAGTEPVSYRIGMLGGEPRLAKCLSTAAALGGWEGGVAGSGQGIAAHAMRGSYVAVLAEVHVEGGRIVVDRLVAAVDCGRQINPDVVRQQVEGGLVFGMAQALGGATGFAGGLATTTGLHALNLPRLADTPDINVELIASAADPGGVSEIAVPPVAPAIANAVHAATGLRPRALPLTASG